jgi:hypothetical protein
MPRWLVPASLGVVGIAVSVATWVGDSGAAAGRVAVAFAAAALVAWWWAGGSGEVATLMSGRGDERQRSFDVRATAIAGLAMASGAVTGTAWRLASGTDPAPYVGICVVGAVAYAVALAVLRGRG